MMVNAGESADDYFDSGRCRKQSVSVRRYGRRTELS
jgi:hypothetical protein